MTRPPRDMDDIDPLPPTKSWRRHLPPEQVEDDDESLWEQVPGSPKGIERNRRTGRWRNTEPGDEAELS